jgi:hypothetical protein
MRPLLLVAAAVLLTACSVPGDGPQGNVTPSDGPSATAPSSPTSGAPSPTAQQRRDVAALTRLMTKRATAIEAGDRATFASQLAPGPNRNKQLAWFDALQELPVGPVRFDLSAPVASADGRHYRADSTMLVQLVGFDPAPVPSDHAFTFVHHGGRWLVARERVPRSQVSFAPWTLEDVHFAVSDSVIVVTDAESSTHLEQLAAVSEQAVADIVAEVPYEWNEHVVLFAPSRTAMFRYEGVDSAEIGNLGGIAFAMRGPRYQFTNRRVLLAPVMLDREYDDLLGVVRHEFAHVAIGRRDDQAPVWVREGLAQYAANASEPGFTMWTSAVDAARKGEISEMPIDAWFFDGDWGLSYGTATAALEWLARTKADDEAPYALLDALNAADADGAVEVRQVVRKKFGVTPDQLAKEGASLIVEEFGS